MGQADIEQSIGRLLSETGGSLDPAAIAAWTVVSALLIAMGHTPNGRKIVEVVRDIVSEQSKELSASLDPWAQAEADILRDLLRTPLWRHAGLDADMTAPE